MSTPESPSRLVTLLANSLLLLVSSTLSLLLLEGAVRGLDLWPLERDATRQEADPFSLGTLEGDSNESVDDDEPAEATAEANATSNIVLHPFLGWSARPRLHHADQPLQVPSASEADDTEWKQANRRRNLFGYASAIGDPRQLRQDDFVIAVFGGSVAMSMTFDGGNALIRRLEERHPELAGKIYLLNLAEGGYKQPQQLFLFQQMMILGVPIDVAVNLDGFNELALGGSDGKRGSHPLFPHREHLAAAYSLNATSPDPQTLGAMAEILGEKKKAQAIRDRFTSGWRQHSELARALAGRRLLAHEVLASTLESELRSTTIETHRSALTQLPDPCIGSFCTEEIALLWKRSSLAMAASSRAYGVTYLHLLQPNQYIEGSKPLSDEERELYYNPNRTWSRAVVRGYPRLQHHGRHLLRRGIDFHDLTPVFINHPETLYRDTCCHLNPHGSALLAEAVADRVAEALDRR